MAAIAGRVGELSPPTVADMSSWTGQGCELSWTEADVEGSVSAQMGELRIVADARLDDRSSLAAALGADPSRRSDPELILAAWHKWGEACLDRLSGDFAFAIWDEVARSLFCVRDQFGVAPLYYRESAGGLVFASRAADLARPQDCIDQTQALLFIAGIDDDPATTTIAGVRRLPAAHYLRWSRGRTELATYWRCTPSDVSDHEDFATGFRERLITAVDNRMSNRPLGAMLSGGLDSSSIVSIAATTLGPRHAALRTFSFSYPQGSPYDERNYAEAVLSKHAPSAHFVEMNGIRPLSELAGLIDGRSDMFFAPGAAKILRVLRAAADRGVATMLDGHGGDEVASHGFGRLTELARDGHWLRLLRELMGVSRTFNASPLSLLAGYYLDHGQGGRVLSRWLRKLPRGRAPLPQPAAALLNPDLARSRLVVDRMASWRETTKTAQRTEQDLHHWSVTWPGVARSFETLRRLSDQAGVALRFPFYDRRLVAYALAIPEDQKLKHGRSRAVLRDAMTGILPEAVRQRQSKINFRGELAAGLVFEGADRLHSLIDRTANVGDVIDLDVARRLTGQLFDAPQSIHGADLFALWRIYALSMWFEQRASSGAVREPSA